MESAESLFGDVLKPFSTASTQLRHGRGLKCCAAVFLPYRIVLSFLSKAREGIRQVKRREFITLLGGAAAAWPFAAAGPQATKVSTVGVVALAAPSPDRLLAALRRGLSESGYAEGRNLRIEIR